MNKTVETVETKHIPTTTIELYPEAVKVISIDENGVKSVRNTNIENVTTILSKEQALETPLLPSQWGVVKYYRNGEYEGYVMTTPPTERNVTINYRIGNMDSGHQMTIPTPPMVWVYEVRTSKDGSKMLTHSMTYALKHELLSLKDKVFHAPYPNIGINHGICWGTENPAVPSSKSIQNIPARFFSQPFNRDLSDNRCVAFDYNNEERDIRTSGSENALIHMFRMNDLLEESKENEDGFSYPFDTLKPVGASTVEDIIKRYMPMIFR